MALPWHMPERGLDHGGVRRVDHERRLDLAREPVEEAQHVGVLVAIGVGEAHVQHLAAAPYLGAADLRRLLELVVHDQVLELPRPDDVGALPHQERAVVVPRIDDLDAAHRGGQALRGPARRLALHQPGQRARVRGRGPAAASDQIHPALVHEAPHLQGEALRRLLVLAELVGQAGVRVHADEAGGEARERAQVVGHELGTGGAVESDGEEIEVLHRRVQRVHALPRQHGPHGLDGAADHEGQVEARLADGLTDPDGRRLDVERVLAGLQQQRVRTARDQPLGLGVVAVAHLVEGDTAGDRDGARAGAHGAHHEAGTLRGRAPVGGGSGNARGGGGDLVGLVSEAIFGQHIGSTPEGIGRDRCPRRRRGRPRGWPGSRPGA